MMVIHGGAHFIMGSPQAGSASSDESPHRQTIRRSFSIAHRETGRQTAFTAGHRLTADHPCYSITWFDAAAYCNWLSSKAGLSEEEWCYVVDRAGLRIVPDFMQRRGYCLPTEAEWEYACRAGTATERFFGRDADMLPKYAVFADVGRTSPLEGGRRKPNDFRLFDMLGNVAEWCQDRYAVNPTDAPGETGIVISSQPRVIRGGSFRDPAGKLRSAARGRELPGNADVTIGFRVARSYP
jgi:formylglycine-generating enzyme required for sulfatase activity